MDIHTQAAISHIDHPYISSTTASASNHGFPLFSPLNALAQPQVINQVNQALSGNIPSGGQIPVTPALNINGVPAQSEGYIIRVTLDRGGLAVNLAGEGYSLLSSPANVMVSMLIPSQIKALQDAHRNRMMASRQPWLMRKARQLCERRYWQSWGDCLKGWYDWGRGQGRYGKQAVVAGHEESRGEALVRFIFMAGIILTAAKQVDLLNGGLLMK